MIIITNINIITMNTKREIITNAAIGVDQDKIVFVGKEKEVLLPGSNAEILDGKGMTALPGFIDTHVHSDQAILRSVADDLGWEPYLFQRVFPILAKRDTKDAVASLKLCMLEMIKSGTTCFVDSMVHSRFNFDDFALSVNEFGMRSVLAKYVMPQKAIVNNNQKIDSGNILNESDSLLAVKAAFEKWDCQATGRIKVWFGPLVPRDKHTCSPEFYKKVASMADQLGSGITIHLGAEKEDIDFFQDNFGLKPVDFAHNYGLTGPNVLLINGCWFSEEEIDLLVKTRTSLAHSPSANMKMASGIADIISMRNKGGTVSLGTDSAANNNAHDMIREMKVASLLHNISNMNASTLRAEDVLEMATIEGAKAIGWDNLIGSIEVGKQADIILIDLHKPHTIPVYDQVANIVYAAHGGDVNTTMVAGKFLMQNRQMLHINEEEVLHNAQRIGLKLLNAAGINVSSEWPII